MPTKAQTIKAAKFRQAVIATLEKHKGGMRPQELMQIPAVAESKLPRDRAYALLKYMAQSKLINSPDKGLYSSRNGAINVPTPVPQLGFILKIESRLARVEKQLGRLLEAWGIEE